MWRSILDYLMDSFGIHYMAIPNTLMMIIRGIIIYGVGIFLARFNKKLMGVRTPFNFLLFVMLGSIFAQAIIDGNAFLPILATIVCLFLINGLMTMLAYYSTKMEEIIKGKASVLVQNGQIQWPKMRKYFITEQELMNELEAQLHTRDLNQVETAFLASDGTINFITKR